MNKLDSHSNHTGICRNLFHRSFFCIDTVRRWDYNRRLLILAGHTGMLQTTLINLQLSEYADQFRRKHKHLINYRFQQSHINMYVPYADIQEIRSTHKHTDHNWRPCTGVCTGTGRLQPRRHHPLSRLHCMCKESKTDSRSNPHCTWNIERFDAKRASSCHLELSYTE